MTEYNPYFTTQRLSALQTHSLKKAKEATLNNYEVAVQSANRLREFGEGNKIPISTKDYKHYLNLARHKLGERMTQIASAEKHNPFSDILTLREQI